MTEISSTISRTYDFGDIYDCRDVPNIKHLVVILGVDQKGMVLYSKVLSRVYKAFDTFSEFLDECMRKSETLSCTLFKHHFGKEKGNSQIIRYCNPKHAFFLDRHNYAFLDSHSLVALNADPDKMNAGIFNQIGALSKGRLVGSDYFRLKAMIDWSDVLSKTSKIAVATSYNKRYKAVKAQEEAIMARMRKT